MEGEKVLIIVADTRIVELAVIKLSNAGFWVMTAADGEEGYKKLLNTPPDLLMVSPDLPKKSGYEIIGALRDHPEFRTIAVMLVVDRTFNEEQFKTMGLKVDDIIAIPFTPKTLLSRVNGLILRSRLVKELNPLTLLPGKVHIQEKLRNYVKEGRTFDLIFVDLKDFKVYNKYYGFERGNEVIQFLADLLLAENGNLRTYEPELFHLGGDDFCICLNHGISDSLCQQITHRFDQGIGQFYLEEDRERGGLVVANRRGFVEQWPVLTITLGIVSNEHRVINDWLEADSIGQELLNYAKSLPGSRFVRDRRHS